MLEEPSESKRIASGAIVGRIANHVTRVGWVRGWRQSDVVIKSDDLSLWQVRSDHPGNKNGRQLGPTETHLLKLSNGCSKNQQVGSDKCARERKCIPILL